MTRVRLPLLALATLFVACSEDEPAPAPVDSGSDTGDAIVTPDTAIDSTISDTGTDTSTEDTSVATDSGADTTIADSGADTTIADSGADTTIVDSGADSASPDSAMADSATPDTADSAMPDTADASTARTFTIPFGSFSVPAGSEEMRCAVVAIGNMDERLVRSARLQLSGVAAEAFVLRGTAPASAYAGCTLAGVLGTTGHLLMLGQSPDATLTFPTTPTGAPVGFVFPSGSFLRIALHAFNVTSSAADAGATLTFDTIANPSNGVPAAAMLYVNSMISIPASSMGSAERFDPGIASTSVFAMTMHTHALATQTRALFGTSISDVTATTVYTNTDPFNAPIASFAPALSMSGKGFAYRCNYNNTTSSTVNYGDSRTDEHCGLMAWYYPSSGFRLCLDGTCFTTL